MSGHGPGAAAAADAPARIGLEVHCQLTSLRTKLFCPCPSAYRGKEPNTNVCPVCMGLPGTLPRLNRRAVESAVVVAASLGCPTPERISFFRKNYFYPDLPKNFQITQLDAYGPSSVGGGGGSADIGEGARVRVRRVQLEEDPGRIVYGEGAGGSRPTLVDYNRAGTALVEIVTEPDMDSPRQARRFLGMLSDAIENLGAADPSLEGAMRADGNVSVGGGPKVEVKNVGSFHDLEKALRFEITRQRSLLGRGIPVEQETRHWDQGRRVTVPARKKESDMDYRYLLEGDIPPVEVGADAVGGLVGGMPEGVAARRARYASPGIGLPAQVADVLSADRFYSDMFDAARALPGGGGPRGAREIANMVTTGLMGMADTRERRAALRVTPAHLADLAGAVVSGSITRASARDALHEAARTGRPAAEIIEERGMAAVVGGGKGEGEGEGEGGAGGELGRIVRGVLAAEAAAAEQARADPKAVNYLVGKVMAATSGRADPQQAIRLIKEGLEAGAGGGG